MYAITCKEQRETPRSHMNGRAPACPHRPSSRPRARRAALLLGCLLCVPAAGSPAQDPVRDYLDAIERAESQGGAYAVELVDLYYGMGQALLDLGEYDGARDAFYQTVMVSRVNAGPQSLEQTRYLYSVADIESRMGNRPGAVQVLDNIYRIHARHYGEDNPDLLPEIEKIVAWYREQLMLDGNPVRPADFQNLGYLVRRMAELTEARHGLGHPQTALQYRELGQVHYQAIRYFLETGLSPNPELVMESEGSSNVALLEQSTTHHLKAGEEAFARAVEAWQENPDATELQRADAMAELGDWYLVFKYFRKARKQYEEAYRLLARSADYRSLADRYLGVPAPLRFLDSTEQFGREPPPPSSDSLLEVSMAVSLTGRLYDIEILKAPGDLSDEDLRSLREHLAGTRFRPAVVNGRSQSVEGYVWKALPLASASPSSSG